VRKFKIGSPVYITLAHPAHSLRPLLNIVVGFYNAFI